jgi:dihydroflavonol-4-reductase
MRAFVTGGTGLLGNNLVRELAGRGYAVRALARSRKKADRLLAGTGVEVVHGDMTDIWQFAGALDGCDVLFHTAAYFREYYSPGDHASRLEQINVRATVDLMREAHRRGLRRAIDTSSSGTIGTKPDGSPGDEQTPPSETSFSNLYFRSKVLAWEELRKLQRETGFEVVSILPGWMFGPHDAAPTSSGQLVLDHLARRIPAVPPGGTSAVDARDVAAAMVTAAERGRPGERYIVGGRALELWDLFQTLEKVSGVRAPKRRLPAALAIGIAAMLDRWSRLTGRRSPMPLEGIRTMAARKYVSSEKAVRELGATFRPFEETLRDEVAWFRATGLAPSKVVHSGSPAQQATST